MFNILSSFIPCSREKREKDAMAQKAREELERQREEERRQQRKMQMLADQKQRDLQLRMAHIETQNLKVKYQWFCISVRFFE